MNNKEAKKSIGPILIGIVAILAVVGIVWFIVSRNNGSQNGDNGGNNNTTSEEDKTKVTAAELSKSPDETVAFGDYTAMFTLSKAI